MQRSVYLHGVRTQDGYGEAGMAEGVHLWLAAAAQSVPLRQQGRQQG